MGYSGIWIFKINKIGLLTLWLFACYSLPFIHMIPQIYFDYRLQSITQRVFLKECAELVPILVPKRTFFGIFQGRGVVSSRGRLGAVHLA